MRSFAWLRRSVRTLWHSMSRPLGQLALLEVPLEVVVELQRLALAAGRRHEEQEALARHGGFLEKLALDLRVEQRDAAAAQLLETLDPVRVVLGLGDSDCAFVEDRVEQRQRRAVRLRQRRLPSGSF